MPSVQLASLQMPSWGKWDINTSSVSFRSERLTDEPLLQGKWCSQWYSLCFVRMLEASEQSLSPSFSTATPQSYKWSFPGVLHYELGLSLSISCVLCPLPCCHAGILSVLGENHPNLRLESREASLSKYSPVFLWGSHVSELQQKLTDFEFGIQHTLPCLVPGNAFVVQSVSTAAEILGFPNVKLVPLTRN